MLSRPDLGLHLADVGDVTGDSGRTGDVEEAARGQDVTLALGRHPAAAVPVWHADSDVVVLPNSTRSDLLSSTTITALSYGRPDGVYVSGTKGGLKAVAFTNWARLCDGAPEQFLEEAAIFINQPHGKALGLRALDSRPGEVCTVDAYQRALAGGLRAGQRNWTT